MRNIVKTILIKNSTINIFHNILHILMMLFYLLDKISLCKKTYKIVFKKNAKLNELNHHVYINFNYSIWLMVVSRINLVSNDTRKNILYMIYTYIQHVFLHVIMFVLNIYVLSNSLVLVKHESYLNGYTPLSHVRSSPNYPYIPFHYCIVNL